MEKAVDESGHNKPGVNAGPKTAFGGNARKRACFCRPYEFSPHQKMCVTARALPWVGRTTASGLQTVKTITDLVNLYLAYEQAGVEQGDANFHNAVLV